MNECTKLVSFVFIVVLLVVFFLKKEYCSWLSCFVIILDGFTASVFILWVITAPSGVDHTDQFLGNWINRISLGFSGS